MRTANAFAALVAGLALAACSDQAVTAPELASPSVVAAEANPVPLKLHCDCGNFVMSVPDPMKPWQLHVGLDGVCQISHLGRATVHIEQDGDFLTGTMVGNEVITAANGDQLFIRHSGPTGGDQVGNVWYSGPIEILGGTGRFAEATGTGTYSGRANSVELWGYYDLEAMIKYAAGQRGRD